ncbi:aldehyde dehydrogenase domain-containing protein [Melampsora americana]|nr:aldehyde dehydrogenase domain-containing protein [Melampsora americana]
MIPEIKIQFPIETKLEPITLKTGLFINNEFHPSSDNKTLETINPSTGKGIGIVSIASKEDVDTAVRSAQEAFENHWGLKTSAQKRGKMLMDLADAIEQNLEVLAAIESIDNGKAYSIAKSFDVPEAAHCLRYYGGWADKNHGKVIEVNDAKMAYTRHEPIGVVGQIIPCYLCFKNNQNFPLLMFAWKIGPALATGNTIVIKPAEQTPLTALFMANLISKIFPPGVINVIVGLGPVAGSALSYHMGIEKIAFTGSTVVGKTIMKAAAESNLKKVTLELGGKSPTIIFDDADLDQAVKWSGFGIFFNHGQCCCAGSRVFVHESVYDEFMTKFEEYAKSFQVGDPFSNKTFQGPLVSQLQFDRVMGYIQSGIEDGAKCIMGGKRYGNEGYFIEPTIFTDVKPSMKIMKEEIFGPVVGITKFSSETDLIKIANDSIYGLAAAVFSKDVSRAIKVSNELKAGTVWVNCYNKLHTQVPFGGFKQSGIGRELGEYALANYTAVKAVHINLSEKL